MTLWIYTDGTEYSLPVYVTEDATQMAKLTGYNAQSIRKAWWNFKHGVTPNTRFEKVVVDYDDKDFNTQKTIYHSGLQRNDRNHDRRR